MSDFFDDFDDSDDTPVPDIDRGAARREALGVDSISGVAGTDFTDPSALDFDNPQAVHQQTVDRNWMIKAREDFAEQSLNTWRRVREEGDFSDAAIPEAFSRTVEETRNALLQDLPLDKDGEVLVSDDVRLRLEDQLSTMASGYHDLGRQRHDTATKAKGLDLMARSAAMAAATATTAPFAVRGAMDNVRSDVEAYNGVFDKELIEHNVHAGQVQVLKGAIDGYVTQGMGDTARQLLTGDKFNDVLTDEDKTALQTHIDRTERRRDIEDEAAQQARRSEAETALLDALTQGSLTNTDIDRIDGLPDDGPGSRATFHTILDRRDAGLVENGTDPTLETDPEAYGDFLSAALDGGITTADLIDRIGDGISVEDATLLSGLSKQIQETGPDVPTVLMGAVVQLAAQPGNAGTPSLPQFSSPSLDDSSTTPKSAEASTANTKARDFDREITELETEREKARRQGGPGRKEFLKLETQLKQAKYDETQSVAIDADAAVKAEQRGEVLSLDAKNLAALGHLAKNVHDASANVFEKKSVLDRAQNQRNKPLIGLTTKENQEIARNIRNAEQEVSEARRAQVDAVKEIYEIWQKLGVTRSDDPLHEEIRNFLNGPPVTHEEVSREGSGWVKSGPAGDRFHQEPDMIGTGNEKWVHPDGREMVFNSETKELVTDPEDAGSYNFANQINDIPNHFKFDVFKRLDNFR